MENKFLSVPFCHCHLHALYSNDKRLYKKVVANDQGVVIIVVVVVVAYRLQYTKVKHGTKYDNSSTSNRSKGLLMDI